MADVRTKDEVARELAESHYRVEPELTLVARLVGTDQQEADPSEPIKLLEVNENTTAVGIRPVFFGPDQAAGIDFASVVVEVTPEELQRIRDRRLALPNGWSVGEAYPPPSVGAA